jgi:LysR family transcriptional activator of nhaA
MMAFGQAGGGYFPAPAVLADAIEAQFGVRRVGLVEEIQDVFYAITGERHITHPAVLAVTEAAQGLPPRLTTSPSSPAPRKRRTGRSG